MQKAGAMYIDDIDVEAHCQQRAQTDRACEQNSASFDDVDIEEWLVKHLEKAGRYQEHYAQSERTSSPVSASQGPSSDACPNQAQPKDGASLKVDHQQQTLPPTVYDDSNDAPTLARNEDLSVAEDSVRDVPLYASIRLAENEHFTAELTLTPDDQIVVDGVKTIDPRTRRICLFLGFLFFLSLVAVGAARLTAWLTSSSSGYADGQESRSSNQTLDPTLSEENEESFLFLNQTIADYLKKNARAGQSLAITKAGELLFSIVNRTDVNFTYFGVDTGTATTLLAGVPAALISKMITPLWNGHTLDGLEGFLVVGQALRLADMYDGMILTSMAGYPLTIQLDPFRVNNVSISAERNLLFKNGVKHNFEEYPNPIVPWIGKSMLDVLFETNNRRNGDLSSFMALIDASPDLKDQLQTPTGTVKATTLFVPTNDALSSTSTLNQSLLADPTFLERFLLNHLVTGNFARSCWWSIPTGSVVSDTELRLESQAGYVLELNIGSVVIINGTSTIIQEDIFSEQGIIHVVDKALPLPWR